jgi:hypothetical protein
MSRARIAQAESRPIERVQLTENILSDKSAELGPLQLARPRTKLGATPATAAPASGLDRLSALMGISKGSVSPASKSSEPALKTPEQMAEEFVRYLAHHDLLNDR